MLRKCTITGIPFDIGNIDDVTDYIQDALTQNHLKTIFTPNPEILLASYQSREYQRVLASADLSLPDGNGLLFASTFLYKTQKTHSKFLILWKFLITYCSLVLNKSSLKKIIPQTIHGSDTLFAIHDKLQSEHIRCTYFGGSDTVQNRIQTVIEKKYPDIIVAGVIGGNPQKDDTKITEQILKSKPDILFVALSFPIQETWMYNHKEILEKAGIKVVIGVGGTFDFLVGNKRRAPLIMRKLGIEFLFRWIIEPKRWKRIFRAVFVFPYIILQKRLQKEADLFSIFKPLH